jgi:hypothetical protein
MRAAAGWRYARRDRVVAAPVQSWSRRFPTQAEPRSGSALHELQAAATTVQSDSNETEAQNGSPYSLVPRTLARNLPFVAMASAAREAVTPVIGTFARRDQGVPDWPA